MAHPLDDREYVLRLDPKGMYGLTCAFPDQCRAALEVAKLPKLAPFRGKPDCVVLTGLGGSAAGGDLVRALVEAEGSVPFLVNRDYSLPHYVGENALVVACSYSGNTEETLAAYAHAVQKGASRAVVTSGGVLAELASGDPSVPIFLIPGGQPPRTALGYLFVPVLYACERWGFVPPQNYGAAFDLLEACVRKWGVEVPFAENPAKQLAAALHGKVALLYGLGGWQGSVAYRWKGQIGENAKNMAFSHSFPELNHNEILAWVGAQSQGVRQWSVVILEDGLESPKMQARAKVTSELIADRAEVHRVRAEGRTLLERVLSLTLFGDFVSLYLAALNGVDPENIDWINHLKGELAKVG